MKSKINKLISIYEIIGGVLGLGAIIFVLILLVISNQKVDIPISIFVMIPLYIVSLAAGVCLLKNKQQGIMLSVIVQILQIPYIVTTSFKYIFISGLQLGAKVTFLSKIKGVAAMIYLGSSFDLQCGSGSQYVILGINFIPILIIGYFIKAKKSKC